MAAQGGLSGEFDGRPCTTLLKRSRDQPLRGGKAQRIGNRVLGRLWGKEKMRVERGDSVAGTGAGLGNDEAAVRALRLAIYTGTDFFRKGSKAG